MNNFKTTLVVIISLCFFVQISWTQTQVVKFDFTDYKSGSVLSWLTAKGFLLGNDASNAQLVTLSGDNGRLTVKTVSKALSTIGNVSLSIHAIKLRITWGVNSYPEGADWSRGINREPIMVIISFGEEKYSAGGLKSFVLDPLPYYIGFFLCEKNANKNHFMVGRSYQLQGRYVCMDSPVIGKEVITIVNLQDAFQKVFRAKMKMPITAVVLETDTTNLYYGTSSAFIKSIELIK